MKIFLIIISVLTTYAGISQGDTEYQDTRRKTESFAKVREPEIRKDLATFTLSGIPESVAKEEFKKIPFTSFGTDSMKFEGDGIKVIVYTRAFEESKHKLMYDEKWLVRIDKKTYYGGYPAKPFKEISSIILTIDDDSVQIPAAAFGDLYNLNFTYMDKGINRSRNGIYRSKDGTRIYLYLFSKDNTGSYEITWVIQGKKYLRRVLDYNIM